MKAKQDTDNSSMDLVKWLFVFLLFGGALYANYHYNHLPLALRMIGWIGVFAVMLAVAAFTAKGKVALKFAKDAKLELRKVVWPTRPETVQTTLIVLAIVLVIGIVIWVSDSFFLWAVSWVTGQRG